MTLSEIRKIYDYWMVSVIVRRKVQALEFKALSNIITSDVDAIAWAPTVLCSISGAFIAFPDITIAPMITA